MATLTPDPTLKFINPYNFVTKTSQVSRSAIRSGPLSGRIRCTLNVRTELALPDHRDCDGSRFNFYNVNGVPTIPGSEIRGCIRNVFEALTQSCYSVMNMNVLTKRLPRPDNSVQAGIISYENGRWAIYPAEKRSGADSDTLPREWIQFKGSGKKTSYYAKTTDTPVYICTGEDIDRFLELLEIYESYAKAQNLDLIKRISDQIRAGRDVVAFYKLSGNMLTYFSPAQISRYMFRSTVSSLLGAHAAGICGTGGQYCPACALFGTLGAGKAVASHLRFGDASPESVTISDTYRNLPELSSPKITSVEFYSSLPGQGYRNVRRWDYDTPGVQLNGRKFYYHSEPKKENVLGPRSMAVKTAQAGSCFLFDVWFDSVSEEQLRQLLWVIAIGENSADSQYCHKLGAGKPAGYGSVKLLVTGIEVRTFADGDYRIERKVYQDFAPDRTLFSEAGAVADFLRIADYGYVSGRTVSYPIADDGRGTKNSKAAHQWFLSNRVQGNASRPSQFRYVLPPIADDPASLELPAMFASAADRGWGRSSSAPAPARQSSAAALEGNKQYNAKIVGSFEDKYGNAFFKISVDGHTELGGKTCKIKQKYAGNRSVGDMIKVEYRGPNDRGVPQFFVIK